MSPSFLQRANMALQAFDHTTAPYRPLSKLTQRPRDKDLELGE